MKKALIIEILTMLLVILFLYSGAGKLVDIESFKDGLHRQHFPLWLEQLLIFVLPPIELLTATSLMINTWRKWGYYMSLILLCMFTGYIALVLMHAFDQVPCPCGGVMRYLTWPEHLMFNSFFVTLNIIAIRLRKNTAVAEKPKHRLMVTASKDISRAK